MASVQTAAHEGRYLQLDVTQESQNQSANTSSVKWKVSANGGTSNYYAAYECKATVDGTVVWNPGTVGWTAKAFPAARGEKSDTFTKYHDNTTGEAHVDFTLRGSIYYNSPKDYSGTLWLDKIPRNPKISSFSATRASETSVKVSWSSDMTIDYLNYSIDNGANWNGYDTADATSGSFTISGLSAGTKYNIKINLRSKTSQLWSGASSAQSPTTYSYPTATLPSGEIVLNSSTKTITFSFTNDLKRSISYSATCGNYTVSGSTTGTSGTLTLNSDSLYNEISGTSATLKVSASATGMGTPSGNITLKTDAGYAAPGINKNYFSWQAIHTNDKITVGTGYMVQNLSYLQAKYTNDAIITLRKGAKSLSSVKLSFGNKTSTLSKSFANHNGTNTYNYSSTTTATITVTDNRGYSASDTVNIAFLPYANPLAGIAGERIGGYGQDVKLTASSSCSSLNNTNRIVKLEYKLEGGSAQSIDSGTVQIKQDNDKAQKYLVNATDSLGNTNNWNSYTIVPIGQPVFFIDEKLKGLGINCFPTGEGLYINGKQQMQRYNIDLSSDSTSNFYPVVFEKTQEFIHCEIWSPAYGGAEPWNQNCINFTLKNGGWTDSPWDLIIHSYGVYDANELTIGCIGFGTTHAFSCIWLRGGQAYNFYSNVKATLHKANWTTKEGNDEETFSVGTNLYGGTNTNVSIQFTPRSTCTNGGYFRNGLRCGAEIYANGNKKVLHEGNYSSYALPLSGGKMSGNIWYTNGDYTDYEMIKWKTGDNNGAGVVIGGGGAVVIGGGESANTVYNGTGVGGSSEVMYIANDQAINFYPGQQSGYTTTGVFSIAAGGAVTKNNGVNVPGVRISGSAPAATQTGDIWFIT